MRRGTTLLETMMSMFVLMLVLGVVAGLAQQYQMFDRLYAQQNDALLAAEVGLERMRNEAQEAVFWQNPTSTTVVNTLQFQKIDPYATPARLPSPLPVPPPNSWQMWPASSLASITYSVSNGVLLRTATLNGSTVQTSVASSISGLGCSFTSAGELQIVLQPASGNTLTARQIVGDF